MEYLTRKSKRFFLSNSFLPLKNTTFGKLIPLAPLTIPLSVHAMGELSDPLLGTEQFSNLAWPRKVIKINKEIKEFISSNLILI